MQPHPSHSSPHASSSGSSLKRPYAQQANSTTRTSALAMSQRAGGGLSSAPADPPYERPAKASKVDNVPAQSHHFASAAHAFQPTRGKQQPRFQASSSRGSLKNFGQDKTKRNKLPVLNEPLHDENHIKATFSAGSLKLEWEMNPKSPLSNYYTLMFDLTPKYEVSKVIGPRGTIHRYGRIISGQAVSHIGLI